MRKSLTLFVGLLLCAVAMPVWAQSPKRHSMVEKEQKNIFITPSIQAIPYRIPAIATAKNGDLVAISDYRYSRADIGMVKDGRLDLRARISSDNGKSWGAEFTLAEGKGSKSPDFMNVAYGDAAIVGDSRSNRMLTLSCGGNVSFPAGTRDNHQNIVRFYSEDCGRSWGEPEDIAPEIYALFDESPIGYANSMFVASGRIFQSPTLKVGKYHRLYCAVLVNLSSGKWVNYVLYSDDFGGEWQLLGEVAIPAVPHRADEAKVEELPDGNILISCRIGGGRRYNIYTYTDAKSGSGAWGESAVSNKENGGVESLNNSCNGEVMILPATRKSDGRALYVMLQSVPLGSGRTNVGIYYKAFASKEDFSSPALIAKGWEGVCQVSDVGSAYSTMCWQEDNTIAFFYEEATFCSSGGGGYTSVYKNLSLEEITDGAYSFNPKLKRKAFLK